MFRNKYCGPKVLTFKAIRLLVAKFNESGSLVTSKPKIIARQSNEAGYRGRKRLSGASEHFISSPFSAVWYAPIDFVENFEGPIACYSIQMRQKLMPADRDTWKANFVPPNQSLEYLKSNIRNEIAGIEPETLQKVMERFVAWLQLVEIYQT